MMYNDNNSTTLGHESNSTPSDAPTGHAPVPLPFDPQFRELASHLWRGGWYGYLWTASTERWPDDHPDKRKRGQSKERQTFWIDLAGEWPDHFPSQCGQEGYKHLYFGVNPTFPPDAERFRKWKFGRRSTNELVAAVNCLFAEADLKHFDDNWQALDEYVDALPLAPSVIVRSGGGLHLYWLLRETYMLYDDNLERDDARFEYIKSTQHKWVESFKGEVYEVGKYKNGLDQGAKDLPRLLRVPTSLNYKPKYAPNYPQVTWVKFDLTVQYERADFERVIDGAIGAQQKRLKEQAQSDDHPAPLPPPSANTSHSPKSHQAPSPHRSPPPLGWGMSYLSSQTTSIRPASM